MNKRVIIIAGPNGAGKTTFAREFLPNEAGCPVFLTQVGGYSAPEKRIEIEVTATG